MTQVDREHAVVAFRALLDEATKRVAKPWFLLPHTVIGEPQARQTYRERVYCYELYHQLRVLSGAESGVAEGVPAYLLSGEIDKSYLDSVIKKSNHKPDLVWHVPGEWDQNAVVVEVKSWPRLWKYGPNKDLETLGAFVGAGDRGYECGVLLVYGDLSPDASEEDEERLGSKLLSRVLRGADKLQGDHEHQLAHEPDAENKVGLSKDARRRIRLLWHPSPGQGVKDLGTLERQPTGRCGGAT